MARGRGTHEKHVLGVELLLCCCRHSPVWWCNLSPTRNTGPQGQGPVQLLFCTILSRRFDISGQNDESSPIFIVPSILAPPHFLLGNIASYQPRFSSRGRTKPNVSAAHLQHQGAHEHSLASSSLPDSSTAAPPAIFSLPATTVRERPRVPPIHPPLLEQQLIIAPPFFRGGLRKPGVSSAASKLQPAVYCS